MSKKVFISHASEDRGIVSFFVDKILIAGSGINHDDIIYTSREDTGVTNGDDIPLAIREGIKNSCLFFMMVSGHYRKSEVCLNEMGAAWMSDSLRRCILLLPDVDFDQIGWLMSLHKGTKMTDEEGLDAIRDIMIECLDTKTKTSTWNRNKEAFIKGLTSATSVHDQRAKDPDDDDQDIDFLAAREFFDVNVSAYSEALKTIAGSLNYYSEKISAGSRVLNNYNSNPHSFNVSQIRGIFSSLARETDNLSFIHEEQTPLLRDHFNKLIKYAIFLQSYGDETTREENRQQVQMLIETIKSAREQMGTFRKTLDEMIDLDKTFTKSNIRLKKAVDSLLSVLSFCIGRANEFLLN